MPDHPTCESCRHFNPNEDGDPDVDVDGTCHRHAPRPATTGESALAHWPTIYKDDWCGEHDPPLFTPEEANAALVALRQKLEGRRTHHRVLFDRPSRGGGEFPTT